LLALWVMVSSGWSKKRRDGTDDGTPEELQTFRTQDLSFPRTKGPYGELSFPRNESTGTRNFHSRDLSFPGTFVLGERKFPGTFVLSFPGPFVLGNFRSGERKFQGTFVPGTFRTRELSFPLSDRPSRRFALCA